MSDVATAVLLALAGIVVFAGFVWGLLRAASEEAADEVEEKLAAVSPWRSATRHPAGRVVLLPLRLLFGIGEWVYALTQTLVAGALALLVFFALLAGVGYVLVLLFGGAVLVVVPVGLCVLGLVLALRRT